MKIDGRLIATTLFQKLQTKVNRLKKSGITPHLVVLLVGSDPASHAYVRQKKLKGEGIGMKVTILEFPKETTEQKLHTLIEQLNNDPHVHAIVIQQPLPKHINPQTLVEATDPTKDVDGFHTESKFTPPIAEAAIEILKNIHSSEKSSDTFKNWLQNQTVTVIGKGETGGGPIINKCKKLGIEPVIIDSKTSDPQVVKKNSDIIISCVGRPNIITKDDIKKDVILLSIGMYRGKDGKLHGDYEEDQIKDIASYYTPVPGGVGPVNVAMLLSNVIKAANNKQ